VNAAAVFSLLTLLTGPADVPNVTSDVPVRVLTIGDVTENWNRHRKFLAEFEMVTMADRKTLEEMLADVKEKKDQLEADYESGTLAERDFKAVQAYLKRRTMKIANYEEIRREIREIRLQRITAMHLRKMQEAVNVLAENSGVGIVLKDRSTLYFDTKLETAPQVGSFLNIHDTESSTAWEAPSEAP